MNTNRYPNMHADAYKEKSQRFRELQAQLMEFAEQDQDAAETLCVSILAPLWQDEFSDELNAKPTQMAQVHKIINSGQSRRLSACQVPDPPGYDHGTLWKRGNKPVACTIEPYDGLSMDQLRAQIEYCDQWGLELSIGPRGLWYPGRTMLIQYQSPQKGER